MKTIILIRHAKTEIYSDTGLDFDRELKKKGLADISEVAGKIKQLIDLPDLIYSSPAKRAFSTAREFLKILEFPVSKIIQDKGLYNDAYRTVLSLVGEFDNKHNSAMFFSHNPDISSLVTFLSGERAIDVPTCSVFCIDFETKNWKDLKDLNGRIRFYEYPDRKK